MKKLLVFWLRAYQRLLSPFLGSACRFYPSCSHYALEAVEVHGCWQGMVFALKRLCRCHPWHPGGVDFVPAMQTEKMTKQMQEKIFS